jgi:Membrane bound FAD containing D-sorbitol dehydrogenase
VRRSTLHCDRDSHGNVGSASASIRSLELATGAVADVLIDSLPSTAARTVTRRELLAALVASLVAASCADSRSRDRVPVEAVDLAAFMSLSRVLTGDTDLADEEVGSEYLAALRADPARGLQLAALWRAVGFDDADRPASVADLAARGVYDDPELRRLADSIAAYWYSGVYDDANGAPKVATYVDALAWRALGYRSGGPSSCSGVFGHWAEKPSAA